MKKCLMILLGGLLMGSLASAKGKEARKPSSTPSRNVQVGGEADMDACGGSGIVTATTTLFTLKNGMQKFDKVEVNQAAYSCDEEEGSDLVGIVYGKPGQDCKVGSPIARRQDYKGPCKSGWIKKIFYEGLAG